MFHLNTIRMRKNGFPSKMVLQVSAHKANYSFINDLRHLGDYPGRHPQSFKTKALVSNEKECTYQIKYGGNGNTTLQECQLCFKQGYHLIR